MDNNNKRNQELLESNYKQNREVLDPNNKQTKRKVLISFLGTGNYVPVYYTWIDGKVCTPSHKTKFVQEAIATKLCKNWSENDCIMVFRTEQSDAKNWQDTKDASGCVTSKGLKSTLEDIKFVNGNRLKCKINPQPAGKDQYIIPTGLGNTTDEMDEIFDQVFNKLEEDDEIYFDVTHAFRTIPLFATVLFNYARFLKGTSLKGIYYGAYEKLDPVTNKAPIADLIDVARLQEINSAAASFRDFGNLEAFSKLFLDCAALDADISNISNALKSLDGYIQTCQLEDIKNGDYITEINLSIDSFCKSIFTNEAQRTLLKTISDQLKDFGFVDDTSYRNIEAAIDWAIQYNMIQQALTMAQEYIVTIAYDSLVKNKMMSYFRLSVQNEINEVSPGKTITTYDIRHKLGYFLKGSSIPAEYLYLIHINPDLYCIDVAKDFNKIKELRNSINHANTTLKMSYEDYKNNLKVRWTSLKEITKKYECTH